MFKKNEADQLSVIMHVVQDFDIVWKAVAPHHSNAAAM